ncbi:MAG: hypothetical protein ACP5NS_03990 [Candidatus Pacearchaeota archaeon]
MNLRRRLSLGLAGVILALTGCKSTQLRDDLGTTSKQAIADIKQSGIDQNYVDLARDLEGCDILYFGETHPVGVTDPKLQPLGRVIPLLKVLTDPNVMDRPYQTIIVESFPTTYDFDGSRFVPILEQELISRGIFDPVRTPFTYSYTHSRHDIEIDGNKNSFGPSHGVESLDELVRVFGNTGVNIRGSLPTYAQAEKALQLAYKESVLCGFDSRQAQDEAAKQLIRLIGKTTLHEVYGAMQTSLERGVKPRIIVFGGKMHNDSDPSHFGKDNPSRFVCLREELTAFPSLRYGSIDVLNLATDNPTRSYERLLHKCVSEADLAISSSHPKLLSNGRPELADYLLVIGKN